MARTLAVAAVPTLVYFIVVLRHLTYAWDDFIQFGVTLRSGVGTGLLTYDLFEHFGPVNRLAHGLLVTYGGLDTRWAITLAVPIFFAYCVALTDLARLLGAGWGRVAVCLVVATVTPATVSIGAVLDQYLHVMLPVTATAAATSAYIRWIRTRRSVHALTGALVVLLACAVQERGVFIVLFLVLARVLVVDGGAVPGRWMGTWIRTWLRDAAFLTVPILVAVATTVVVALRYAADTPRGELVETLSLIGRAWAEHFVPMVTGTYGLVEGAARLPVSVLAHAAVVGLLIWTVGRNAWNMRPWLLLLAWFGFMMCFLGLGRLGLGPVDSILGNLQYYVYALPAVVVLIASLTGDRATDTGAAPRWAGGHGLFTWLARAGAGVLACLMVVSALSVAERSDRFAADYLDAAVDEVLRANAAGAAVIAPTRVPDALVPPAFFPYNSGELFLREIDRATIVDLDPRSPRFLDDTGHLTEGSAHLLARVRPGRSASDVSTTDTSDVVEQGALCLSADDAGRVSAPLRTPVDAPGGAVWLRVVARGDGAEGAVAGGHGNAWSVSATGSLVSDHGSTTFLLPTERVSRIDLLDVRADRLCIDAIEVWALSAPGAAGCDWVGPGGESRAVRPAGAQPDCRD